ncbi:hypothetical protein G6F57_018449 [Rhizopus arrhizus]|nr:hypothetical protein G6F57_018449 [Rhizopus arrhizus]
MPTPTLEQAKLHLRVDFDADDTLITSLLAAAVESASNYLGRPIPWPRLDGEGEPVLDNEGEVIEEQVPESVNAAIKLELGALYANREPGAPVRMKAGPLNKRIRIERREFERTRTSAGGHGHEDRYACAARPTARRHDARGARRNGVGHRVGGQCDRGR